MKENQEWQASLNEHRSAWILALCCLLLILITSLKPDLFKPSQEEAVNAVDSESTADRASLAEKIAPPLHEDRAVVKPKVIENRPVIEKKAVAKAATSAEKASTTKAQANNTKKTVAKTGSSPAAGYYVQLGAFREKPRAQGLADQLKRQGWQAIVSKLPNKALHAVWAGPKTSQAAAEKLQAAINKKMKIKGFIIQKKQQ